MAALNAWMNGEWVGTWHVQRGTHIFTYAPTWLESEKSRPLSLSLPLTRTLEIKGEVVANYFDNLLPDSARIRERIARRFKTKTLDTFALLEAIGPIAWVLCNCCPKQAHRMDGTASSVNH